VIDNRGEYRIKDWQTRGWSAFADHDGGRSELAATTGQSWACPKHLRLWADQPDSRDARPAWSKAQAALAPPPAIG
jgi:hypothetical protein